MPTQTHLSTALLRARRTPGAWPISPGAGRRRAVQAAVNATTSRALDLVRRARPWPSPDGRAREASATIAVGDWWSEWSKNGAWRKRRDGRVYLSTPARKARGRLARMLALAAGPVPWPAQKTWLAITVWLPSARADSVNAVDGICDAAKVAIKLDDRWFAIRWLDWAIDPAKPRITVVVTQEAAG